MRKILQDYLVRWKSDNKKNDQANEKKFSFVSQQFKELIRKNLEVPIKLYHL